MRAESLALFSMILPCSSICSAWLCDSSRRPSICSALRATPSLLDDSCERRGTRAGECAERAVLERGDSGVPRGQEGSEGEVGGWSERACCCICLLYTSPSPRDAHES
eukprot:2686587-Prymnesium_polylepis.1